MGSQKMDGWMYNISFNVLFLTQYSFPAVAVFGFEFLVCCLPFCYSPLSVSVLLYFLPLCFPDSFNELFQPH